MAKLANAIFGGQRETLTYLGYGTCPKCGDESAEIWADDETGKKYVRCPFMGCEGWGKLQEADDGRL